MTLVSYGGDPKVIASRAEIERGRTVLQMVQQRLVAEIEPADFLADALPRAVLALHTPVLLWRIERLQWACAHASDSYLSTEARITNRIHWITEQLAQHPLLFALLPPRIRAGIPTVLIASVIAGSFFNGKATRILARETVDLYPALVGGSAGAAKMLGGRSADGSSGRAGASTLLAQVGPFAALGTQNTQVQSVGARGMRAAPVGIGELAARVAQTHQTLEPQVTIERYSDGRRNLLMVYVPGMRNLNPLDQSDPFGLAGSVHELADAKHASCQVAVENALERAGLQPDDQIIVAGYSQGGMVAAELAASHPSQVVGVVTLGSPIAQVELPSHIPILAIEHSNDVVPALSGKVNPLTENLVTISREVVAPSGGSDALAAHDLQAYLKTAEQVDSADAAGITRIREAVMQRFEGLRLVETQTFDYQK